MSSGANDQANVLKVAAFCDHITKTSIAKDECPANIPYRRQDSTCHTR